nr:hypothetical protein [Tanacetum cinerariifolium]
MRVRMRMTRESQGLDDEGHGLDDEGKGLYDEVQGLEDEGPDIDEEEEAAPEGQQQAVLVVDIAASEPLDLGYGMARHRALESTEEIAPSTYEVVQSSRSVPEHEGAKRVSAYRQPTLVTWVDPEDSMVYTDILTYAPPDAPVQTPPSPEWSLEVRAQIELHGSILQDHTQPLDALLPTLFERYDRDLRELHSRSGEVRDEIFSQRYRFRSLEQEQERATMTFSSIWRPVLALEHTNFAMATLADKAILSGADNRPPMLEKDIPKKYSELSATEATQADCDVKATNIILQGLPPEVYALVSNHRIAKEL